MSIDDKALQAAKGYIETRKHLGRSLTDHITDAVHFYESCKPTEQPVIIVDDPLCKKCWQPKAETDQPDELAEMNAQKWLDIMADAKKWREHKRESGWQPIGAEQKGDGSDIGPIIFAGAAGVRPGYVRWNPYGDHWESAYSDGEKNGLPYFPVCVIPPTHWMALPEIEGGK